MVGALKHLQLVNVEAQVFEVEPAKVVDEW
jgi:hypothetical protein